MPKTIQNIFENIFKKMYIPNVCVLFLHNDKNSIKTYFKNHIKLSKSGIQYEANQVSSYRTIINLCVTTKIDKSLL